MKRSLRILHLEDEADYSDLVKSIISSELSAEIIRVAGRVEYEEALRTSRFDIILADYSLPQYDGASALQAAREICPDTPFLLLSGVVGEGAALETLRAGATDYVLKSFPERLVPAVQRAIREASERAVRKRIEKKLQREEQRFQIFTENALDVLAVLNGKGEITYTSPSIKGVLGFSPLTLVGQRAIGLIHPDDRHIAFELLKTLVTGGSPVQRLELRLQHATEGWRYVEAAVQNRLQDARIQGMVVNFRDITERKHAERELRQSEEQWRLVFDGNPNPMWIFDEETLQFLAVNDAAVAHYGYTRNEFLKLTLSDLRADGPKPGNRTATDPLPLEYLHKLINKRLWPRLGCAGIWSQRKKDGTIVDVEIKWSPVDFQGRSAFLGMANDITERKRAEEALRDSEQRFRDLFHSSPDGVCVLDQTGAILDVNPTAVELHGSNRESLVGKSFLAMVPERTRLHAEATFSEFWDGKIRPLEWNMLTVHGGEVPLEIRVSRANYSGKPALLLHVRDVTERKHAEAALRSSENLFHSVWENSVDGMRLTDAEGTIVTVNQAFCNLVNMSRADLLGQPFTIVYASSENHERILRRYRERFAARSCERQVERQLTLRSGKIIRLEDTSSFVEQKGAPPLLLSLFRDVTVERRLEEQLRQSQKMDAIGQLAGGVAHDFNNILTVIHGHASLLLSALSKGAIASAENVPPQESPLARSAKQIAQAAERAAGLTRQLLTFGRRQLIQPRRLDVNTIVANMTKMLSRILGEDIALDLEYSPAPATVVADAGMLEQVLLNLSVNSRDAMPHGGVLQIRIFTPTITAEHIKKQPQARQGNFVCLAARDTGCGIPAENLRRIFEPFFTTKEVGKGTGLGLATVYAIVTQHEGWIEVDSAPGQGAEFRIYLPFRTDAAPTADPTPQPIETRGGTETILVVEDEHPVRELVSSLLAREGYRVLQAESGPRALALWEKHKHQVHLLLTDLIMPDHMNGRELAEHLLRQRPDLKVIFTTGYSMDVLGKEITARVGFSYLQKPYEPQKLIKTVRDCLDSVRTEPPVPAT